MYSAKLNWINSLLNASSGHNGFTKFNMYLRSSYPSLQSCIHPHRCPLSILSPPGRWWGQRCTSGLHCLPLQLGSGSSCAGFRYTAGPPGVGSGRRWPPGSCRLARLPVVLLQDSHHRLGSQTGSEVKTGGDEG